MKHIERFNEKWQIMNEDINKSKMTIIDDSVPVTNNREILDWLVDCQTNSHRNGGKNLSNNLLDELESKFGPPNKSMRLEFMTRIWILEYNDLVFNIFTAKGRGTTIEICGFSFEDIRNGVKQKEIIKFLEELHKLINL